MRGRQKSNNPQHSYCSDRPSCLHRQATGYYGGGTAGYRCRQGSLKALGAQAIELCRKHTSFAVVKVTLVKVTLVKPTLAKPTLGKLTLAKLTGTVNLNTFSQQQQFVRAQKGKDWERERSRKGGEK